MEPWKLSEDQLLEVRRHVAEEVTSGLQADGHRVAALDAHLPPPTARPTGEALVVDVGGTNVRAARVRLGSDGAQIVAGPLKGTLRVDSELPRTEAEFFSTQAKLAAQVALPGSELGYVFSYPARIRPDGDAVLLRWTKGLEVKEMVGQPVGAGLLRALEQRGVRLGRVTVLNDTVAALMGGSARFEGPADRVIGLIAGTGTNMAAFFHQDRAPKLDGSSAVNLESGNLHPPHLTPWDDQVDRADPAPGAQRFEKAVSGHYLPLLYAAYTGAPPPPSAQALVQSRTGNDASSQVAAALLDRSADLVAAGLAGVFDLLPSGPSAVLAEGGLFWGDPQYEPRVRRWLRKWMPDRSVQFLREPDVNLVGAAVAALRSASAT